MQNIKKGYYIIANKKTGVKADKKSYINTNISSVSEEEYVFLDDLEMSFEKQGNSNVAVGRKIFIKNNITTQQFPWDRTDLMGDIGICRAQQTTALADLMDDGEINGSAKGLCVGKLRSFTRGQIRFTETSYSYLEDWHGDDFHDALYAFLQSCNSKK